MIAIDGNEANVEQRVGSNVYAYELLKGLAVRKNLDYQVYLKSAPLDDLPVESSRWQYRVFGPGKLWTQWRLPLDLYLNQPKPQVFFTPGHYAPRFSPVPTVISVLDVSYLYFPEAFQPRVLNQLKQWTEYSVRQASHILTISNSSKADIVKEYQVDPAKITVTHLGSNMAKPKVWNTSQVDQIKKKYAIPTKYFLFIGTRQPKKNLDRLLRAFKKLRTKERNISLVVVGKTWHQFSQTELDGGTNVVFTGYVPDEDLSKLMLASEAFVFPSLYEGFGIPVLDAMHLGVPVAASNVSSIPEITGKSPLLFDPYKIEDIESVLRNLLHMSADKRKKIIREGKIRAKQFSWEKCVKETEEVLERYGR